MWRSEAGGSGCLGLVGRWDAETRVGVWMCIAPIVGVRRTLAGGAWAGRHCAAHGNRILMCNQVCIRARAAHTRLARLHGHRDWHPQGTIMRGQCPGVLELCERYAETFSVLIRSDGSVGRVAFVPRWVTRETGPAI